MPALDRTGELIPAIGYIRVSMAREEMISPELQESAIKTWAKQNRRTIVKWVVDLDATGRNFKRKIMKAISYIEDGTAKEIAVWKYSRFGRNRHGNAVNLERVERVGGQLESATEQVDARTAVGRFQRGMLFEVAAFESDRAGEQWKETHEWRRSNGLPSAGKPRFGYTWYPRKIYHPDGSVTLQQERYEPIPEAAPVIAELYRRYIAGDGGFDALARDLNAAGFTTVRGYRWWGESLRWFMDSGFAAGYLRVHSKDCRCEPYLAACPNHELVKPDPQPGAQPAIPPIIDAETWAAYKAKRELIRTVPPRARKAVMPLSGLSRCALCGGTAPRAIVKPYVYLHCANRHKRGPSACKGTRINYELAEKLLLEWLQRIAAEIHAASQGMAPPATHALAPKSQTARIDELAHQRDALERAVKKHMRVYALSEDDDPDGTLAKEYQETLRELRSEKVAVEEELGRLESERAATQEHADARETAVSVAAGLLEEWDSLGPEEINVLLRRIVRCVKIGPDRTLEPVPVWA